MNNHPDKSLIHISFDFPDSINSKKPRAIANLINAQKTYKNIVFSLNRTANPFADFSCKKEQHGYSLNVFGLPFGIGLRIWMYFTFKRIYKIILTEKINFNLIHAHKLTFEGLIARHISRKSSVPYIITIRGFTDINIIKFQPFNRKLFLKTLQKSSKIIYLAPWTEKKMLQTFRGELIQKNSSIIPNIIQLDNIKDSPYEEIFIDKFVTVFHLDSYKTKNIKRTILAMDSVHNKYPNLKLDIIGGGKSSEIIQSYINKCTYPSQFTLLGKMEHEEVLTIYNKYLGFVMPSFPETFGLVFIEALYSGIPILFSSGSGIDGYFDDWQIGEKVFYKSVDDISQAIIRIYTENSTYRNSIKLLKKNDGFLKFTENFVSIQYINIVKKLI